MEALESRYPDLAFLLSVFPHKKTKLKSKEKPFLEWLDAQSLEGIELVYVVGLFSFSLPEKLQKWLSGKQERALVFLEYDLGAFTAFEQEELFNNPQIHFHHFQEDPCEALAETFPTERLLVYCPKHKTFPSESLIRYSARLSALFSDVLYSHSIVHNVISNYRRLEGTFAANKWQGAFRGIPAVICGAGPSLEKLIPTLKKSGDKALIFGCGSGITALSHHGVRPHFAMAVDPNLEEYERLKASTYFEGPFLFAPRLHKDVFATTSGPFGFLKTDTGGLIENWLEERCSFDDAPIGPDLGPEAFSVTTLAVSYAYALGCSPIILAGVDLAYTGGRRYAAGVEAVPAQAIEPRALEKVLIRKDLNGKPVETLLKWVMEADCISAFAKEHKETKFINSTEGGLGFKGIKNISLEIALSTVKTQDLFGMIHHMIQEHPLEVDLERIKREIASLSESLKSCCILCQQILHEKAESGRRLLYRLDLEEETAFTALLSPIDAALDRLLPRYYPSLDPQEAKIGWERAKYQELLLQIERFHPFVKEGESLF